MGYERRTRKMMGAVDQLREKSPIRTNTPRKHHRPPAGALNHYQKTLRNKETKDRKKMHAIKQGRAQASGGRRKKRHQTTSSKGSTAEYHTTRQSDSNRDVPAQGKEKKQSETAMLTRDAGSRKKKQPNSGAGNKLT